MGFNLPTRGFDGERYARTFAPCGGGFVLAGLALGGPAGLAAAVVGVLLLALATHSRADGFVLLGPAVRWELTQAARRGRMFLWRALVVSVLLLVVGYQFLTNTGQSLGDMLSLRPSSVTPARAAAAAGHLFVAVYLFTAFAAALAALATLPGVVAEERESGRLDHVLTTDLRNREVVVGKLVGRFGVVAAVLLAVAPLPALLPLIGGVDGRVIAAAAATIAFGLFGIAGVGLWQSADARRSWDVSRTTAVIVAVYLFAGLVAANVGSTASGIGLTAKIVGVGNPVVWAAAVGSAGAAKQIDNILDWVLYGYVPFHFVVFGLGLTRAVGTLRAESPMQTRQEKARTKALKRAADRRPPVSDRPVLWYELYARSDFSRWVGRWWKLAAFVAVVAGLLVADYWDRKNIYYAQTGWGGGYYRTSPWQRTVAKNLGWLCRYAGLWALLGVTLPAAFTAAQAVAREKERDTFEALILSGIRPGEMLRQKWLGAVLKQRGRLIALAVFGLVAVMIGTVPASGFVALVVTTVLNTTLGAALGVILGAYSRTVWQASARLGGLMFAWAVAVLVVVWYAYSNRSLPWFDRELLIATIPPMPQVLSATWGLDPRAPVYNPLARPSGFDSWSDVTLPSAVIAVSITGLMAAVTWPLWEKARRKYARDLDPVAERPRRRRATP